MIGVVAVSLRGTLALALQLFCSATASVGLLLNYTFGEDSLYFKK